MHGTGSAILGPEIGAFAIVADHDAAKGWSVLRRVPREEAALPIATPAIQYALSVFEGLKAYRDPAGAIHLFRGAAHAARFVRSAERLCLPPLPEETFVRACAQAVAAHLGETVVREGRRVPMLPPHGQGALYLRPTLYGSEEYLGVRGAARHQVAVVVTPASESGLKRVRLRAEREFVRSCPGGAGAAKTGANYGAALFAQRRAQQDGFDDVLWLDALRHRDVGEAGTMNVFFAIGDRVVTPALDGTILAGITRDTSLVLLREIGHPVEERAVSIDELDAAARRGELIEAFGVGTALRLVRIDEIVHDGVAIRPSGGELAVRLRGLLAGVQEGRVAAHPEWREPIEARSFTHATGR